MSGRIRRIACWWNGKHDVQVVYWLRNGFAVWAEERRCKKCGRELETRTVYRVPLTQEET